MSESASDYERENAITQTITYKLLLYTSVFDYTFKLTGFPVQKILSEISVYPRAVETIFGFHSV